jgi:lipopolysaccharide/colanic/teichoic acid biosynthesis glycosyltransferase
MIKEGLNSKECCNRGSLLTESADAAIVHRSYLVTKAILDFICGCFFLLICTPVILLAAIAVRIESKGNPFFLQDRVGKGGKIFRIIKLRGMYVDAKERFPELYDYSSSGRDGKLDFYFHYDTDPRVTKVGAFIRKTSIDELPNFINVVLGQMSMVGPRPEVPELFDMYGQYQDAYIAVRPGVTSVSKCSGRDHLTKKETLELDIGYLANQSTAGDMRILWRTVVSVLWRINVF